MPITKEIKKTVSSSIVELYKHLGKHSRAAEKHEPRGNLLARLECSEKIPKCLDNSTMFEGKSFLFLL